MRATSIRKGTVALAAVLGLLVVLASPASANTKNLEVTGGTLTSAGQTFDLDPEPDPDNPAPCEEKTDTLNVTFNGTAGSGTWSLAGGWSSQFQLGTPPSGAWYQADFSILASAGSYTASGGGPPYTYSLASTATTHVIFQVQIYAIAPDHCAKDMRLCVLTVRMSFTGSMTSAAQMPTATAGDTATLSGSSVAPHISVTNCSAPFTAFGGQTATVTSLGLLVL
jgi:hypothetical protein